ncbi:MAG: hypothetical protein WD738_01235 [Pirellulales bacterium]
MPGMKWDELNPSERLIAEQAVMNFRSLNVACDAAADGQVLAVAETLALQQGRELIRRTLEVSLQQQAQALEKKVRRSGPARAE